MSRFECERQPARRSGVEAAGPALVKALMVNGETWESRARALARIISALRPDAAMREIRDAVLREALVLTESRRILLALHESPASRTTCWRLDGVDRHVVTAPRADASQTYFFPAPAAAWRLSLEQSPFDGAQGDPERRVEGSAIDSRQGQVPVEARTASDGVDVPIAFRTHHPFTRLACIPFDTVPATRGRMFLFDSPDDARAQSTVDWLTVLAPHLAVALAGFARLRHVQRAAAATERARLGRELHDGPIQALLAIRLQLELLRRRVAEASAAVDNVDRQVQDTTERLRETAHQTRVNTIAPAALVSVLSQMVSRFGEETAIAVRFASDVDVVNVAPRTAYELAAIVREALVNVRRHSGATKVSVHLSCVDGVYHLSIEDNGHGFGSAAQHPADVLPATSSPAVIAQRVAAIGGQLQLAAAAAGGARLDVSIAGLSLG